MKFLFLVQGEGRGHLTQAISMRQMLHEAGHTVVQILVGTATERQIPDFFCEQIQTPIQYFRSPNLIVDADGKVNFLNTFWHHIRRAGRYKQSLRQIDNAIAEHRPDVVVNFYEVLAGLYSLFYRSSVPVVCVGHQYLFLHSDFVFPAGRWFDRLLLLLVTRFTAIGAQKLLALSFIPMAHQPNRRIFVAPPLLRQEIKNTSTSFQNYLLVYVNYPHLVAQVEAWHAQNPAVALHCFYDNKSSQQQEQQIDATLTFHQLNGEKFLKMMANCRALVTTAGFESVGEALYFDKPTLMVPAHFEQLCNAVDAQMAGAGIGAATFDLSVLTNYLPHHQSVGDSFRHWYNSGSGLIVSQLENAGRPKHKQSWLKKNWPRRLNWQLGDVS